MPSMYLQTPDIATFGAVNATVAQIAQAGALINAFLRRPAGLLYTPDSVGRPCYMTALNPELTFASASGFGPGNGIAVEVTGPTDMLQVGDAVVLDRATPSLVESVQITSISGQIITLGSSSANVPSGVQFAHSEGCTIETGLVITEKRYLPKMRSVVSLANVPVSRVIGGTGRYAYGRRGDAASYNTDNFNLLASLSKFGGPPAWEIWPANAAAGIDAPTGQLWVPAGIMLAYYSEIKVRYVAGFQYSNLPAEIKLACAQLIAAQSNIQGLNNLKIYQAGDTKIEQFASSLMTDDTRAMLQPWKVRAFA